MVHICEMIPGEHLEVYGVGRVVKTRHPKLGVVIAKVMSRHEAGWEMAIQGLRVPGVLAPLSVERARYTSDSHCECLFEMEKYFLTEAANAPRDSYYYSGDKILPKEGHVVNAWIFYYQLMTPLSRRNVGSSGVTPEALLRDIGKALAVLHKKGYYHGDVKLPNIVVDERGRAFLIDCDRGREIGATKGRTNTYGYTPPEQILAKDRVYDGRAADLYGLGICLLMLQGGFYTHSICDLMSSDDDPLIFDLVGLSRVFSKADIQAQYGQWRHASRMEDMWMQVPQIEVRDEWKCLLHPDPGMRRMPKGVAGWFTR